jgi:hypothetical protein
MLVGHRLSSETGKETPVMVMIRNLAYIGKRILYIAFSYLLSSNARKQKEPGSHRATALQFMLQSLSVL